MYIQTARKYFLQYYFEKSYFQNLVIFDEFEDFN